MSYNYAEYQVYLTTLMATTTSDPFFISILPACIDYAEQRIYRELDILNTRFRDTSQKCTVGNRLINLPAALYVAETIAILTPAGTLPPTATRNVLSVVTHDFIDLVYPNDGPDTYQAQPQYVAMLTQTTALVGPSPDQDYGIEVVGTQRPAPLSATNSTTVLTDMLPDLFLAASMIFMSGYQKNFGAQADDPKMSASWEQQYQSLMTWAKSEEFRKKFQSSTWTSMIQSTVADKQRG